MTFIFCCHLNGVKEKVNENRPVHGGSGSFYSRRSLLLLQVPQGLGSALLHNPPQGPLISSACAAFSATLFSSHRLPTEVLDTELWEQPICSEMSFCVLHSC